MMTEIDLGERKGICLIPHQYGTISPIVPYKFKNMKEIESFVQLAQKETLDSLYFKSKSLWQKFVSATDEQLTMLAADTIFTYFQDRFATTHYLLAVGPVGSGKGAILVGFKYLGYRVILASSMSGPNLLDMLGSVEVGQVVVAEDELDNIDEDKSKQRIYKVGYDRFGVVPKTLDGSLSSRHAQWYFTYCYKIFAAERGPDADDMQGFNDRTFRMTSTSRKPKVYVKSLESQRDSKKNKDIRSKLEYFRKLMMIYRMLHHNDEIKEVKTNIENRPLELVGGLIQLFSTPTMITGEHRARDEILKTLTLFLQEKGQLNKRTINAAIYEVLKLWFEEHQNDVKIENRLDGKKYHCYTITNEELCRAVMESTGGRIKWVSCSRSKPLNSTRLATRKSWAFVGTN